MRRTLSTEAVRELCAEGRTGSHYPPDQIDALADFDQWLTDHDRQQRADALRKAAYALPLYQEVETAAAAVDWLNERADAIEGEGT